MKTFLLLCCLGLISLSAEESAPLPRGHAHNDYEHPRPLFDALEQGFCSVEADIHAVGGQLLVAHDRAKVAPDRTLQKLYLDPLRDRAAARGGKIYGSEPYFFLLIDIKGNAEATYKLLSPVLDHYTNLLTSYEGNEAHRRAVTVVLSGSRPRATVSSEKFRRVALDGLATDLEVKPAAALVPWISENWTAFFSWRKGAMPEVEHELLNDFVKKSHAQGRLLRFWGAPDTPEAWTLLLQAGVDLINTDRLKELRTFLDTNKAGVKAATNAAPKTE